MATTSIAPTGRIVSNPLTVIERILRDRDDFWRQIHVEEDLSALIVQMLASSAVALACYGAVLGFSHSALQALSSAIKLPILFQLTLLICLPTLYLFNLVLGSKLSVQQALAMVLSAITVMSMLTLAFAPISLFFLITAPDYDFFKLLNVAIFALTGVVGLRFLMTGMRRMNSLAHSDTRAVAPPPAVEGGEPVAVTMPAVEQPVNTVLLQIWVVLFGFVGTQLGWTLRPFFGSPDYPFEIFRRIEGNFYVNIAHTIQNLLR